MRDNNAILNDYAMSKVQETFPHETTDYTVILKYYDLEYQLSDYYLQVGEIKHVQGWILHLSVVIYQIGDLYKAIIPVLLNEKVPFKIPMNKETALYLMNGYFGNPQLGKIMSIYPENEIKALSIAKKIIQLTKSFKGPNIPTDIHLGSIVYTRYGSCNPIFQIDTYGKKDKYIYNIKGELVKDPYSIPFKIETGISWPFADLASPVASMPPKLINKLFKITSLLKGDARGNVYKGIYVKGLFRVSNCVIKQGKKHMYSEETGRDIYDRLLWQRDLQQELSIEIPIPAVYDFFIEKEDTYLVMEYIQGISLFDRIKQLNPLLKAWFQLNYEEQIVILDYIYQILLIAERLHQKGYVHRDIQPANFLITPHEQVVMIDIELAWSLKTQQPSPPFELGTPGFMSPEQEAMQIPSIQADIYSIGALLATLFTGLSPVKFKTGNTIELENNLHFFIHNWEIAQLIAKCLSYTPDKRPDILYIKTTLHQYQQELQVKDEIMHISIDYTSIATLLTIAIAGIAKPPIVMSEDVWYSKERKRDNRGTPQQKEYTRYAGLYEGVAGTLYMLSRVKKAGYSIDSCMNSYEKSWQYIKEIYLSNLEDKNGGLYQGAAGVAITIKEGIQAGILKDNDINRQTILQCLSLPAVGTNLSQGIAGNGVAILQCIDYLPTQFSIATLQKHVRSLLQSHQKDGSWLPDAEKSLTEKISSIGFAQGVAGIVWFLLSYVAYYDDIQAKQAAIKGLSWLQKRTNHLKDIFDAKLSKKIILPEEETGDERTGIILTFIKAYEILKDEYYRITVENALNNYSDFIVTNNFSQDTGLAGLGELYIEASHVFNEEKWMTRAAWIAQIFENTVLRKENTYCYWQMEENNQPTADLMMGNAGIIHFLSRYLEPTKIGYRLLR